MGMSSNFRSERYYPPSYHERDQIRYGREENRREWYDEDDSEFPSPAPFVASGFSPAPSHPDPLRSAPPRPASRAVPLQPARSWTADPHRRLTGPPTDPDDPDALKDPFADPVESVSDISSNAPSSWRPKRCEKNIDHLLIFSANVPFFVMSVMDIVGAYIVPKSDFSRFFVRTGPFMLAYVCLGVCTAAINIMWFFTSGLRNRDRDAALRHKYMAKSPRSRRWMTTKYYALAFFAIIGVCFWPMIEVWGIRKYVKPVYISCEEQGFNSTIVLQVVGGRSNQFMEQWMANNATITSDDETFGLTLSPTIRPGKNYDNFYFTPSKKLTTPSLFSRIRDNEVVIHMTERTYEFQYTVPKARNTFHVKNGTFSDDRENYLSFPTLSPPIHSTTKANWTHVGSRPWVELVDDRRTVLKTVENHAGDKTNTMMRMCGAWSVTELMADEQNMEAVLVGLARMMVELAEWGLDY